MTQEYAAIFLVHKLWEPTLPAIFFFSNISVFAVLFCFSHARIFVTPWTAAHQAPLSMGILQVRIVEWIAIPFSMRSSQPRDWTHISYVFCIYGLRKNAKKWTSGTFPLCFSTQLCPCSYINIPMVIQWFLCGPPCYLSLTLIIVQPGLRADSSTYALNWLDLKL